VGGFFLSLKTGFLAVWQSSETGLFGWRVSDAGEMRGRKDSALELRASLRWGGGWELDGVASASFLLLLMEELAERWVTCCLFGWSVLSTSPFFQRAMGNLERRGEWPVKGR
jgi:hypothetical protein